MPDGAALYDVAHDRTYPLGATACFTVGRNPNANLPIVDLTCSRQHFQIVRVDGRYYLEPLSTTSDTRCDGRPVLGRMPLHHGAILQAGNLEFRFLETVDAGPALPAVPEATMIGGITPDDGRGLPALIPLRGEMLIGRDAGQVAIPLPHPQVSRKHARVRLLPDARAIVTDLNSANGTFVGDHRLHLPAVLKPGEQLGIGPYQLLFTGHALIPSSRADNVLLAARGLCHVVAAATGPLVLLEDVNLILRPRELVALVGPSGSGKTTLLRVLSARLPPQAGTVLLNGLDLYAHFEALKHDLVVVPQRELLHETLTVAVQLRHTARMRLPPDTHPDEIERRLDTLLQTVGLADRKEVRIDRLSGGQRKRVSLANELAADPGLLFLDEVTSGLDEQADRELMTLFRAVARAGKTVVCITHNLTNVERTCHRVAVLAPGGRLAFFGTPADALTYFQIDRLGDVYDRLAERPAQEWQNTFARHPAAAPHAPPPAPVSAAPPDAANVSWKLHAGWTTFRHQFPLLAAQAFRLLFAEGVARAGGRLLFQCLIVAVLLVLVFGDVSNPGQPDANLNARLRAVFSSHVLFMMAVSCVWFGCNNSAKELIRERAIYLKERQVRLQSLSYFAGKFAVLAGCSLLQAVVLYCVTAHFCKLPGAGVGQLLPLLVLALTGVALGLFLSAAAGSEEGAIALVPVVLIPQIILSDAFRVLDGVPLWLARLGVPLYWGHGGLRGLLPDHVRPWLDALPLALPTVYLVISLHTFLLLLGGLAFLEGRYRLQMRLGTDALSWTNLRQWRG